MKRFLKYSFQLATTVVALAYIADFAYTFVYGNSAPRNKFQYIFSLQDGVEIDNVFLGSSRTANHIVAKNFSEITGQSTINLGIEGAVLEDNLLELKILLGKQAKIKRVYLQVDYLYEKRGVSNIGNSAVLPFVHETVVKQHLEHQLKDFEAAYYLPFYRYLMADHAIGFREFFFTAAGKKSKIDFSDGFSPKTGSGPLTALELPETIANSNPTISRFKDLCAQNGIELVLFCAPFCSETQNLDYIDKLKEKLPELHVYSSALPDQFFYNCGHLNQQGALVFTALLAQDSKSWYAISPPRP